MDISAENLQARREWDVIFEMLTGKKKTLKLLSNTISGKPAFQNWKINTDFPRQRKSEGAYWHKACLTRNAKCNPKIKKKKS